MMNTIPHLVRMSNFPFQERVLAVDTAPLMGDKVNRPGVGTLNDLRNCTEELVKTGVVDRVVDINYDSAYQARIYRKHFGTSMPFTHNYKGYPILGSIFTIEECVSDYMLHFDSDMLLYQNPDYNWIEEGMAVMQSHPELMSVRPLTGPPRLDGKLYQRHEYEKDPAGFYKFKFFSSRVYLIDCQRFERLLPLPILLRPYRNDLLNRLPTKLQVLSSKITGKGAFDSWEIMVSQKLENSPYWRGILANTNAWTLHPKDRSPKFIQALPHLIERIEAGDYPLQQAGHYDLISELWLD